MRIFTAAVPPFMKNGYLVAADRSDAAVLIDPGDEVDELVARAAAERLSVRAILLTHAHLDHITGVEQAKAAFARRHLAAPRRRLPLPRGRAAGPDVRDAREDPAARRPVLRAGQRLTVGDLEIAVHPTPGHSPGGVCLEIRERGATQLFAGDTLFAGSIGRTDLPGGDYDTLIRSIRTVLFAFPDETPVHSGPWAEHDDRPGALE